MEEIIEKEIVKALIKNGNSDHFKDIIYYKLINNKLRYYKVETPRIELGSKQAAKRLSTYLVFS